MSTTLPRTKISISTNSPDAKGVAAYLFRKHRAHFQDLCPNWQEKRLILESHRPKKIIKKLIAKTCKKFPRLSNYTELRAA